MRYLLSLSFILLPVISYAQAANEKLSFASGQAVGFDFLQAFLGLGLMIGIIALVAFFLRKLSINGNTKGSLISILASSPVGTKEKVVLIQVADQQILLGVGQSNVQAIHVFEQPIEIKEETVQGKSFLSHLKQAIATGGRS